jgi:ribonuclease III
MFEFLYRQKKNSDFKQNLVMLLGFRPSRLLTYTMALTHSSINDSVDTNNERLEYLGDAVLGTVVGFYLFQKYPYKGEGFLTEMRSKMVNRNQLNQVGRKLGLDKLVIFNKNDNSLRKSQIFGNALEALIGAIFVDKGYKTAKQWIETKIIDTLLDMDELENTELNFKNKLIAHANKLNMAVSFNILEEHVEKGRRIFIMSAELNNEVYGQGRAFNKKDASQLAAQNALTKLAVAAVSDTATEQTPNT